MNRVTHTTRSTNPADYQHLAQQIGAMVKTFPDGHVIPRHDHDRDQLLYCVRGVMRLKTDRDAFIAPPDRAVYIPAGVVHAVEMQGDVEMRTLYIAKRQGGDDASTLKVLTVSPLLRELIVALCDEPVVYERNSRGDAIARLIGDEIGRAHTAPLSLPLPRDPRLQRLCAALLADPADRRTLEGWSEAAGASARTLARLFESDLGLSFGEWRRRLRFQRATEALSRGAPIAEVAAACGYQSPSAFSAAFQKFTGQPPSRQSGRCG